ncbi:cerebellin-1-like [Cheilinus undulatus]|uniref:cerebellin-1-like n=1 Tax=Cheilinus undulatus TaxID=241271 RepID=UPI001BD41728|nr:cerebellin-1-like [Cheilinus undulatus]
MLWLVLLFCGAALAQDVTNATVVERCSPDMCDLLKQFGAMSEKLSAVETKLQDNVTRLQASEAKLRKAESSISNLRVKLRDSDTRLSNSEIRLQASEAQVLELKNKGKVKMIFSAAAAAATTRGNTHVGPFLVETTLIYRTVITNIGNAYNSATGVFTAPVAGVYYFTFFYTAEGARRVHLMLYKNNLMVVTANDPVLSDNGDNGGNAVYLPLARGDRVYVRMGANSYVYGNGYLTTFSGSLITQL